MVIKVKDMSVAEQRRQARERFAVAERMENEYLRSLRQLTRQIDHIVKGMAPNGVVKDSNELQQVLTQYSRTIEPWARAVAEKMIMRIARKDEFAWTHLGKSIGRSLRREIQEAPTGEMLRRFLDEQVTLITSLPIDAAQRVHKLTLEGITEGTRAKEIAAEILKTGKVTASRAKLIARTEVARTASGLTMARAQFVGATHYHWRTSGDSDVRKSHKEMNGKVIPFGQAPTLSDGTVTHAGQIFNCRCWIQPILEDI